MSRAIREAKRSGRALGPLLALAVLLTVGGVLIAAYAASATPAATFYPTNGEEVNGFTPLSRHVVVAGDETVAYVKADWNGDGTWDANATGPEAQWHYVYTQPGVYNGALAACTSAHVCRVSGFVVNAFPGENPACMEDCESGNAAGEVGSDYTAERALGWFVFAFIVVGGIGYLWLTRGR